VQNDTFRKDLFYRLKVITINLPPLRERPDDVSLLVAHFLRKYCKKNNRDIKIISRPALHKLMHYEWPGNVRELENLIERAVILCRTDTIVPEDLQLPNEKRFFATDINGKTFHDMIDMAERQIISDTLSKLDWDKEKAAELLNISRASLYNKIKKHKIQTIISDDM
jgi:transcriptional regulator with PAS, ATPase and Fis domain